jgi:hypothetical protein
MEVHSHTHTARKKWTHYFWEFLMLFLAVFCGFLAEYQLEHKIEKDRERQFMKGMLEDLGADTVMMNSTMEFAAQISKGLDSLQSNLFNADNIASNSGTIYRQNFTYMRLIVVSFSDQTATQLRNSGTLRLIRKTEIANAISSYWQGINSIEHIAAILENQFNEIAIAGFNLFNRNNLSAGDSLNRPKIPRIAQDDTLHGTEGHPLSNYIRQKLIIPNIRPEASLLNTDKIVLFNYANRIHRIRSTINLFFQVNLMRQNKRGESLISLIKKEYHLK